MKEIKAYVHENRVTAVIQALNESKAFGGPDGACRHNLTAYVVKGSLLALDASERHYSMALGNEVINEYKLELLCEDIYVEELVAVIRQAAHTGSRQAGWIYVVDIASALRID